MPVCHPIPTLTIADPWSELGHEALWSYWKDIVSRYGCRPASVAEVDAAMREFPSDDLVLPHGVLVVAVAEQEPVGCGGVRLLTDGIAELTRVQVAAHARRRGLGGRIISHLERHAFDHGRIRVRLDVRSDLVEACALYARLGYREVLRFNNHPYVEHWFEKHLWPSEDGSRRLIGLTIGELEGRIDCRPDHFASRPVGP